MRGVKSRGLNRLALPAPAGTKKMAWPFRSAVLTDQVLSGEGLTREAIKIKHPRDSFFSKGERAAVIRANDVTRDEGEDSLYAGQRALKLSFSLPRGCYATILVKRITAAAGVVHTEPMDDSAASDE